jgi:Permuted papain-like amidase enzyme, YaeF/YiiX, C92 family
MPRDECAITCTTCARRAPCSLDRYADAMSPLARWSGRRLAAYLTQPIGRASVTTSDPGALAAALQPGDVLLVDGNTRISRVIRTLTQSTWSHAALCVTAVARAADGLPRLLEADVKEGVREVSLARYADAHTRICRPVGLHGDDLQRVLQHARNRLGHRYDLKNVVDLARYLLPAPAAIRHGRSARP